jgi:hypothetical protein
VLAVVVFEWMVQSWADRATGDAAANRQLRNRVMAPVEIPVLAFAAVALLILSVSRVLLAVSKHAAVWVAIGVAGLIMLTAIVISLRPKISRNVVAAVILVIGVGIITGGIVSASIGARTIHPEPHPSAPRPGAPTTTVAAR